MSAPTDDIPSSVLGDKAPERLAEYYAALDGGRPDDAADVFTADALYAVPAAGPEGDPRRVSEGREAIRQRFHDRGQLDRIHEVQLCVVDGDHCLVEGIVRSSGVPAQTFVASTTVGADGISRYLAFACNGARDPILTSPPTDRTPAVAADVLHRYFSAMDDGDFETAAACFSEDVLYSHPPYRHTDNDTEDRVEFRSRAELRAAFDKRGRQAFAHRIIRNVQRGPHALIEGVVTDLPHGGSGSFISSLSLDDSGLIRRYVSFYCEPSVEDR